MAFSRSENKGVARNLPRELAPRTEAIFLPGSPRRALAAARATALSDWLFSLVFPCASPPPSRLPLRIPSSPPLAFHRRCGCRCRGNATGRLLDYLQPQLACLPPQCFDLLLLHLGLVLLLVLTHVRQPVLQRQIDDPCQFVRRGSHCCLSPQPPFHPPQEPAQRPPAVVQALRRQPQRLRRTIDPPARPAGLDPATGLLPVG